MSEGHKLMVLARVQPAVETDWNHWYDTVHVPEILACPGFRRCTRHVAEGRDGARTYVALYDVDGPEVLQTPEFAAARGWGPFKGKVEAELHLFRPIFEKEADG